MWLSKPENAAKCLLKLLLNDSCLPPPRLQPHSSLPLFLLSSIICKTATTKTSASSSTRPSLRQAKDAPRQFTRSQESNVFLAIDDLRSLVSNVNGVKFFLSNLNSKLQSILHPLRSSLDAKLIRRHHRKWPIARLPRRCSWVPDLAVVVRLAFNALKSRLPHQHLQPLPAATSTTNYLLLDQTQRNIDGPFSMQTRQGGVVVGRDCGR